MGETPFLGLRALLRETGLPETGLTSTQIGFVLAPQVQQQVGAALQGGEEVEAPVAPAGALAHPEPAPEAAAGEGGAAV